MTPQENFDKTVMDHYHGLRAQGITRQEAINHCSLRFGILTLALEYKVSAAERPPRAVDAPDGAMIALAFAIVWTLFLLLLVALLVLL